jgi:hypothetical protein
MQGDRRTGLSQSCGASCAQFAGGSTSGLPAQISDDLAYPAIAAAINAAQRAAIVARVIRLWGVSRWRNVWLFSSVLLILYFEFWFWVLWRELGRASLRDEVVRQRNARVCVCVCVLARCGQRLCRPSKATLAAAPHTLHVLLLRLACERRDPRRSVGIPPGLHAWFVCERNETGGWASTPVMTMASAAMLLRAVVALLALSNAHGQNWYFNCNETLFDNPAMSCAGLLVLCNTGNVCRHITPFTSLRVHAHTALFAHMEPNPFLSLSRVQVAWAAREARPFPPISHVDAHALEPSLWTLTQLCVGGMSVAWRVVEQGTSLREGVVCEKMCVAMHDARRAHACMHAHMRKSRLSSFPMLHATTRAVMRGIWSLATAEVFVSSVAHKCVRPTQN